MLLLCVNLMYTQLGRKKSFEKRTCDSAVEPQSTSFQNCLQFDIGVQTMYDGQNHQTGLRDPESVEKGKGVGHGERSQDKQDQNHRMDQIKVLLKDFVLELPT